MPTFQQNLNVLRHGPQKRKGTRDKDGHDRTLPIRDHYERWALYHRRQYPSRREHSWADPQLLGEAVVAPRDTPFGIVDTLTRESITYWLPEIMDAVHFFHENSCDGDGDFDFSANKTLAEGLRHSILDILERVDCNADQAVRRLATALKAKAEEQLIALSLLLKGPLTEKEKCLYHPKKYEVGYAGQNAVPKKSNTVPEPITEARILDSSLAWDLSDTRPLPLPLSRIPSPRKRRFSQTRDSPGPDPADNGQAWNSPEVQSKRQKFEISITNTVRYSDVGEHDTPKRRRIRPRSPVPHDMVDLTEGGDEDDSDSKPDVTGDDGLVDTKSQEGQCVLM